MPLIGTRTFVGFGLGAIQSGLFLYEAFQSAAFRRLVVAEVSPEIVAAVRREGGYFYVNIAHPDRVESVRVGPIEIFNPTVERDRQALLAAVAEADELATAVPSVAFYISDNPGSIHRLLAAGLCQKIDQDGRRAVIYAAENHNHAAEILEAAVMDLVPMERRTVVHANVRFLNTVIGKMSQVVADPMEVQSLNLAPISVGYPRAFLVEAFSRILISKINFPQTFQRGIQEFQEKEQLLPFEEAKLYGHNATHALLGYLGSLLSVQNVADLVEVPGLLPFARAAFLEESGAALIRKYTGLDPLFTRSGYMDFTDDLLNRMTNPFLVDKIERVTRDTGRKLGWNDRLAGTMRMVLEQGIVPCRYALGTAAAVAQLAPDTLEGRVLARTVLEGLWREESPDLEKQEKLVMLVEAAMVELRSWRSAGFPELETFFQCLKQ